MRSRTILCLGALAVCSIAALPAPSKNDNAGDRTVHEWGTFTSVAGESGEPISWRSYGGASDLPCFVNRFPGFKGGLPGTVRMETPVLYFYGSRDWSANVSVQFPKGTITEWYPQAAVNRSNNSIEWRNVGVSPQNPTDFPAGRQSHYFAARQTDALPLRVEEQREKFLFYRGVGTFPLPVSAKLQPDGTVVVKNSGTEDLTGVIAFENLGGVVKYGLIGAVKGPVSVNFKTLRGSKAELPAELERILVAQGLYAKEAHAMLETWRDSWFEEGTRLFYIVPQRTIDSTLPLRIEPSPASTARVFVGRVEILTDHLQANVRQAVANKDRAALEKYGRFLQPIASRAGIQSALIDEVVEKYVVASLDCSH